MDASDVLEAIDVGNAARNGDPGARDLIVRTGRLVGETLATLVNFFAPSLVIVGGGLSNLGDQLLAASTAFATIASRTHTVSLPPAPRRSL